MRLGLRWFAILVGLAALAPAAHAQYNYPGGYGGYGWGGWGRGYGGYGGAGTVGGSVAQGMGAFAAGEGVYNLETAQARSINANTAQQWDNYIWQTQQAVNRIHMDTVEGERKRRNEARHEIYDRLRNNPTEADVNNGEAMNVVLDELSSPKIYLRALKGAGAKIGGEAIRDIPFQKASAAITTSMHHLAQDGPPAQLQVDDFRSEMAKLKELGASMRKEDAEQGKPNPATLQEQREVLRVLKDKVAAKYAANTPDRTASDNYIKALFGLSKLLETPAINVLLSGVDKHPEATVGDLLSFMKAYNLRFGVADQPDEKEIYGDLYPQLAALRNEAYPAGSDSPTPWNTPAPANPGHPGEFFSKMDYNHVDPKTPPPPPTEAPAPAANPDK